MSVYMEEKVCFCSSVLHLVVMHHLFTRLFEVEEVDWSQFKAHHTGWPLRLLKGNHTLTEQMSGTLCNLIPCGWISHPYSALTFSGASHYTSELNFCHTSDCICRCISAADAHCIRFSHNFIVNAANYCRSEFLLLASWLEYFAVYLMLSWQLQAASKYVLCMRDQAVCQKSAMLDSSSWLGKTHGCIICNYLMHW